jgi:hypothetical protein
LLRPEIQWLVDRGDWFGLLNFYLAMLPWDMPDMDGWTAAGIGWIIALFFVWRFSTKLLRVPRIPWRLGSVTIDLRGGQDTIHAALGGSSGNGKSSALLPLLQLDMPVAAIGFDDSKPLQDWWSAHAHDERYIHWRMDGDLGWDILHGPALYAAEGLTAGFERHGDDTGYYRGLARDELVEMIEADDAAGRPRNMWRYVDLMFLGSERGGDASRACRRWAGSFRTLLKTLGPALGNDFNLTDAMRQGKKVLVMPNRFMLPESADLIGGIGLVQVRRAAAEVGNFLVFVEEAGQARAYEKDIDSLFQAGRTRGCPTVLITQNMSKLREQVTNNIKAWVVFGQEARREAVAAAEQMWTEPEVFLGLKRGIAWIRAPGVGPVRVKLPLLKPPKVRNLAVRPSAVEVPRSSSWDMVPPQRQNRLNGWHPEPLALPARATEVVELPAWVGRSEERQRAWRRLERATEPSWLWTPEKGFWQDGPCLLWTGASRGRVNDPRPAFKMDDGRTSTLYRETFLWAGGQIPESYQIDHLCAVPLCCEPTHLEAVTSQINIARRDGRKRALETLDARLVS